MKYRICSLLLCAALLFSLTACGQETAAPLSEAESTGNPQSFGTSNLEGTPVEEAQTTFLPTDSNLEPVVIQDKDFTADSQLEPTAQIQDHTKDAVTAALIACALDHLEFSPTDDQFLWRAVGYLAGQLGTDSDLVSSEGDFGALTQENAKILAYAVNGSFSGELPVVTEEDPLISRTEDGDYLINMLSQGTLELQMTENRYTSQEDTVTEEAELFQDGINLGSYTVTLQKYQGSETGNAYFAYSILDLSPAVHQ